MFHVMGMVLPTVFICAHVNACDPSHRLSTKGGLVGAGTFIVA